MSAAFAGRAIAAVGVTCGLVAIWIDSFGSDQGSTTYWHDGTLGAVLLACCAIAGLILAAAQVAGLPGLGLAAGVSGGLASGLFAFQPVVHAYTSFWDTFLETGAFLGLCAGLIPIGAVISCAGASSTRKTHRAPVLPVLAAVVGAGLVLAGIWSNLRESGGSYWSYGGVRSPGIFLLVTTIVALVLLLADVAGVASGWRVPALVLAAIIFGFTLFGPVVLAFHSLGLLREGAWLAAGGGLLLVGGAAMLNGLGGREPVGAPPLSL